MAIIDDLNSLPENRRNKKGWFDPKTGKITVVVPNHGSTGDIIGAYGTYMECNKAA